MKLDFETIQIKIDDGIAIFHLNNPPVNQLSPTLCSEMAAAFQAASADNDVQAIVLTGTGSNFMAGADITELQAAQDKETLLAKVLEFEEFYNSIEEGAKPVIAAINGPALGGGLELTMVCHYRIAAEGIKVGQPEVQLGLIPGAGGTQRLPRLVGLPEALQMITTGVPISAEEGLQKGLLDEVVPADSLIDKAVKAAGRFISGEENIEARRAQQRTDRLPNPEEKQKIIAFAKDAAAKKAKGLIAPFKAIEAMEKGLSEVFGADIQLEAELFTECAVSDIAKNLIGIFLNSRSAGRLPRIRDVKPNKIKTVAMLGLGVMGTGITNLLLRHGYRAILWDVNDQAIVRGLQAVRKTFAYSIKKGKMTEADLDRLIADQSIATTQLEKVAQADLVIEAVLEDMQIKKTVWKQVEAICPAQTIFATNTSALPITELANAFKDPGRMLGLHFFNPAERMQLLEIINAKETSDTALATGIAFGRAIKKIPVVVNDGPGFYVSRQLNAFMGECNFMLEEGIDLQTIESSLVDFGMPMGPFILNDLTGIDIGYHVAKNFEQSFGERWKVSVLHDRIFKTGCFGRKTGSGYFDYSDKVPVPNPKVLEVIQQYMQANAITPQEEASPQDLARRMLARAINEAAYMLEEGICERPQDMDLAMVYGCGYPAIRGGILRDADVWGIGAVVTYLKELEGQYGIRFKPAALLQKMAESGKKFYSA
jgi:3-hydroxyacyl-CoA dehydrogenase/enoyl-CoA hydratase/carnithine racemase